MDSLDFLNVTEVKTTFVFGDEIHLEVEMENGKKEIKSDRDSLLLIAEKFYEAAQYISNKRRNTANENQDINTQELQRYPALNSMF